MGDGPTVVLLHGFPEFWWSWRHQLESLSAAGFRVIAMDLRGYGGSDKPPHGYDLPTLAADVAAVIRALGARSAVVIGHDWGALVGWTLAVYQPEVVLALGAVAMSHPRALRAASLADPEQRRTLKFMLAYQSPFWPERRLLRGDAAEVGRLLHAWSGPSSAFPEPQEIAMYRSAMLLEHAAHSAAEYYRWAVRGLSRRDGAAYLRRMDEPIEVPVLQVHGSVDPIALLATVEGAAPYVTGKRTMHVMSGIGHFPHEEAPAAFDALALDWLAEVAPST